MSYQVKMRESCGECGKLIIRDKLGEHVIFSHEDFCECEHIL
jgi:hypothetical protein